MNLRVNEGRERSRPEGLPPALIAPATGNLLRFSVGPGWSECRTDSVGAVKNKGEILNGTKWDGTIPETGQHVEVKSGESVSNTEQLRNMGQAAVDATGKPLKVVTTNPSENKETSTRENKNVEFHKSANQ